MRLHQPNFSLLKICMHINDAIKVNVYKSQLLINA